MTAKGLETVLEAARIVQTNNPETFKPLADFFGVNIDDRLNNPLYREGLYYDEY